MMLAAKGAKVVVNDKSREKADEVVAAIKLNGGEAMAEYSDIATSGEAVVAAAQKQFNRLDILVCSEGPFEDCKLRPPLCNNTKVSWRRTYMATCGFS